jgi:hypothetical protein
MLKTAAFGGVFSMGRQERFEKSSGRRSADRRHQIGYRCRAAQMTADGV